CVKTGIGCVTFRGKIWGTKFVISLFFVILRKMLWCGFIVNMVFLLQNQLILGSFSKRWAWVLIGCFGRGFGNLKSCLKFEFLLGEWDMRSCLLIQKFLPFGLRLI
ncbi:hypothetical protein Goshw_021823, partial [Gossypium schwendimanii]|nr:hypothetical protein [Gossypium schwendimanii]